MASSGKRLLQHNMLFHEINVLLTIGILSLIIEFDKYIKFKYSDVLLNAISFYIKSTKHEGYKLSYST